jgi:hypothetical protein
MTHNDGYCTVENIISVNTMCFEMQHTATLSECNKPEGVVANTYKAAVRNDPEGCGFECIIWYVPHVP